MITHILPPDWEQMPDRSEALPAPESLLIAFVSTHPDEPGAELTINGDAGLCTVKLSAGLCKVLAEQFLRVRMGGSSMSINVRKSEPFIKPRLLSRYGTKNGSVRFFFTHESGEVVRVQLSAADFCWLAGAGALILFPWVFRGWLGRACLWVIARYARIHSPMSSGMPSVDGSPNEGQAV